MNLGFTMSTHYCGGRLANSALTFGQGSIGCGMESEQIACDQSYKETVEKKSCCENDFAKVQIEQDYDTPIVDYVGVNMIFIAVFVASYINLYFPNIPSKPAYLVYAPPLLNHDIQVMYQCFLI